MKNTTQQPLKQKWTKPIANWLKWVINSVAFSELTSASYHQ